MVFAAVAAFNTGPAVASGNIPGILNPSFIDEFRLGIMYNDLHVSRKREEGGVNLIAEVLFQRPNIYTGNKFLTFVLNPRPHIGGQLNTAGDTSQAYAGLTWDYNVTSYFFVEGSFGAAVHSGPLQPTAIPGEVTPLGCRVLFRSSFSAGYNLTEKLRFMITYDHISNANLCSENGGLSTIGARFGYKF